METLLPIIKREVIAGSTIYSDEWPAYNKLGEMGYNHIKVNHSISYVIAGNHSNTTESCWGRLKLKILRIKRDVSDFYFESYLHKEWFRSIKGNKFQLLNNVINAIGNFYNIN